MKILFVIAGFFAILIAVAGIILLIIAIAKKKEKAEPQKEKAEKGNLWGKVVFIGFWVIVVYLGYLGYNYFAHKPVYKPVDTSVQTQNWQLCWQKVPGHEGKSMLRQKCMPAEIQTRTPSYIVVTYRFSGNAEGVMEGTSTNGRSYKGNWKDRTGWGKWSLQFVSSDTAFGWSDDKGKGPKMPNVLERKF